MRFLRHVALRFAQAGRVRTAHIRARHLHHAARGIPKAHEQLAQRRLARTAAPGQVHHAARFDAQAHVVEHGIPSIGEVDATHRGARERPQIHTVVDLLGLRALVKQLKHAPPGRKRLLQRGAEIRHGDDRAERRHEGGRGHKSPVGRDGTGQAQRPRRQHHRNVERQHQPVRQRHRQSAAPLEARFRAGKLVHAFVQLARTFGRSAELQRLAQASQAVKHERVHTAQPLPQLAPAHAAGLRGGVRHRYAHQQVGCKSQQSQRRRYRRDERRHARRHDERDDRRGQRVSIEHFQQFDIAGHKRNKVAFVAAFQLRRSQAAQRGEHAVAHERQQLEREIMVAQLLAVAQRPARDAADGHERQRGAVADSLRKARQVDERVDPEHREEDGRPEAQHSQHDGQRHPGSQRAHEPHQPQHHRQVRSARRLDGRRLFPSSPMRRAVGAARRLGRGARGSSGNRRRRLRQPILGIVRFDRRREALELGLPAP